AAAEFQQEGWKGKLQLELSADLRYAGQGFELNVPISRALVGQFHNEHHRRYGYSQPERSVEIVTLRLRARMRSAAAPTSQSARTAARGAQGSLQKRKVVFASRSIDTAVLDRDSLSVGKFFRGPAIVTEYSATTVVPQDTRFQVDSAGNLVINIR